MRISVVGTGYVGLVTGACLAELGNHVVCLDLDAAKIAALQWGRIPIHEPGLDEIVHRNVAAGRLAFTMDPAESVAHGTVQFIAVGTPAGEDGSADTRYVLKAARDIGRLMTAHRIVVVKSTVPAGTCDAVRDALAAELRRRDLALGFSVVSNPEFLKEGSAVADFMRPDRVLVGSDDEYATRVMRELYAPFQRNRERFLVMRVRSAELAKYAANAMLATRISFMNELANLAERVGADIDEIRYGIGSDARIGHDFLYAGCGYGGSCFPKDVKALNRTAQEHGMQLRIIAAVDGVNERQKRVLPHKILARFGNQLAGRRFALWGLAFKAGTDDMREAPSRELIETLVGAGARVCAYDPAAMDEARRLYAGVEAIEFASSPLEPLIGADALVIVTEWRVFRNPDFSEIRALLKHPVVFDGRNLYDPSAVVSQGLEYYAIGRPAVSVAVEAGVVAEPRELVAA
jgi:UDPglucose 6-dehydrogenase